MKSIKSNGNRVSFDRVIYIIRLFIANRIRGNIDGCPRRYCVYLFFFFFLNARRDSLVIRDTRSKIVSSSRGTQVGDKIVVNRCIGSIAGWFIEHRVQRVNTFSSQIQGRSGWSPWGWCTFSKRSCDERLPTLSACNFFFLAQRIRAGVLACPTLLCCVLLRVPSSCGWLMISKRGEKSEKKQKKREESVWRSED